VTTAWIGLGSNLGDREGYLRRALAALDSDSAIDVAAISTFVETEPVGFLDQPNFLNAVARVETELGPRELLERLLAAELQLGRTRDGPRFGPRTIDLDLLLFGNEVVDESGLQVPHLRLHERRFVLEPLVELDPNLVVPGRGAVQTLLAGLEA
jgi:2-amino-4-hydroxy-6-hydroxymethyldihydropteridine diphosphokinase